MKWNAGYQELERVCLEKLGSYQGLRSDKGKVKLYLH